MAQPVVQRESDEPSDVPQALRHTLRAADVVLDLLPIATCICDPQGRIVLCNRRAREIWGRAPQPGETHAHFTSASRFFRPDGTPLPYSELPLSEVLATGQAVRDKEVRVERPDGTQLAVEVSIDPLIDAGGELIGAVQCFQDVTERVRMTAALTRYQQDLSEQEQRLAATYEHAAIGIVETDAGGNFLRVNEAICAITGMSRDELLGSTLFARTHSDDAQADRDAYARQVRGELDIYSVEKRFQRRDGKLVWMAVRSSAVRDADGRFLYGVRVVQDVTARKASEDRQQLLLEELNHRVKNTLATVQALATQTARGAPDANAFRQVFESRLMALSQAHDQLTLRHWQSADLHDIIAAGTGPYFSAGEGRVAVQGQELTLRPRAALTLAMTFHELTTNAAKYGALSTPAGRIAIRWETVQADGGRPALQLEWHERGGPPVTAPTRRGFGTKFIVGSIGAELGGTADLTYAPEGLHCRINIPLRTLIEDVAGDAAPDAGALGHA
jgi:PAS domain S-box-containing protein